MDRFTTASVTVGARSSRRPGTGSLDAAHTGGDDGPGAARGRRDVWLAAAATAGVAAVIFLVSTVAYTHWPPAMKVHPTPHALAPSGFRWLQAWSWWDGAWYVGIADHGYTFTAGRQSPVAFFPAYPLLVRAVTVIAGNAVLAGFLLTLACGVAAVVVFQQWAVERVGRRAGRLALAALLLYPCSFYLFGVLYADALFLLAAVAAFAFLERDRPVLAGLAAALATATRPIGLALVVGLWARTLERRGVFAHGRASLSSLRRRDAGLLLAPLGFVAYSAYLWARSGHPLQFLDAERGWGQAPGWRTWLKVSWFREMRRPPYLNPPHYHLVGHLLVTIMAVVLVVAVFRRLGWGYGIYTLGIVVGSAVSTKNFIGMGRYTMAAFPCFAVAATFLSGRPAVRWTVLAASGALLVLLTELHARNMLIS